ncbi:SprB repeat-containing protein [Pseudomonas shirazensis]
MMKKLYFILILIVSSPIFAQSGLTYTIDIEYYRGNCNGTNVPPQTSKNCSAYSFFLKNGTTTLVTESMAVSSTKKTYTIPVATSYNFSIDVFCSCLGNSGINSCSETFSQTILAKGTNTQGNTTTIHGVEGGITGNLAGGTNIGPNTLSCAGTVSIGNFRPNGLVISKPNYELYPSGKYTPPEYIAGQQLDLIVTNGFPTRYPDVAYHWQYSLDNKVTWIDVPAAKNNTPTPQFTMEDLMGSDHVKHFGLIDFRIGYSGRPFTNNTYQILYSPGAPLIEKIAYKGPVCGGDNIKTLEVFFSRDLFVNEDLSPLYVQKKYLTVITPLQSQPAVEKLEYDAATGYYKYSFVNLTTLEHGAEYEIKYQARIKKAEPRGVIKSSELQTFFYYEPQIFAYSITDHQKPSCIGGNDGFIEITITNGTGPYNFYIDNNKTNAVLLNGKYYLQNLTSKDYKIKVTDVQNCIDKTATD